MSSHLRNVAEDAFTYLFIYVGFFFCFVYLFVFIQRFVYFITVHRLQMP